MTTPDATALLDRRAELLRRRGDGAGRDVSRELDSVTEELRAALDTTEPMVRRVRPDEPGELLDRLAAAEPVHPVSGPDDLADRLAPDRRCFVLEHPALPGRPMNVVWVALWTGVAQDIAAVLDPSAPTADPAGADTAVFYSIWNVEEGLSGLPGGARLLSGAMELLREELPHLRTFVTLSPIPGFREWWEAEGRGKSDGDGAADRLAGCALYLTSLRDDGRPLDPVARFHLGNGARLLALAPHGDRSGRGMERSFGIMANYRYEPEDRRANRVLLRSGRVAVGEGVSDLLDAAPR